MNYTPETIIATRQQVPLIDFLLSNSSESPCEIGFLKFEKKVAYTICLYTGRVHSLNCIVHFLVANPTIHALSFHSLTLPLKKARKSSTLDCDTLDRPKGFLKYTTSRFCLYCVAYFQGAALKSIHFNYFLNKFYVNDLIVTKLSEIIWLFIVILFFK